MTAARIRSRFVRVLVAAALLGAPAAALPQADFPSDSTIQAIIDGRVAAKAAVGLVVAVAEAGQPARIYTAGTSGAPDVPLGGDAVFEIGSITKAFTGILLADMAARGEVKLDDPVSKYLPPTMTMPSRGGREITLVDLATHSSGLPRMPDNFRPRDPGNPYADYTETQMYDFLSRHTLTREIGSQYEYSNLGMGLLGHALARRAGKSYEALVIERILAPLGMNDTRIALTGPMRGRLVTGHGSGGQPVRNWDLPALAGAGALRSTANDMMRFLAANLDSTIGPLHRAMAFSRARRRAASPNMGIALGWHIIDAPGGPIVWHNGGTGGYRTFSGLNPATGRRVVVLANSSRGADDIGFHLLDRRLPLAGAMVAPAPPRAHTEIALAPAALEAYVGVYELAPQFHITITREDSALFGQATGQSRFQLYAETETEFFLKVVDARITFVKSADGAVERLILHQGGQDVVGRRIR